MSKTFIKSDIAVLEEFFSKKHIKPRPVYTITSADKSCRKVCVIKCFGETIEGHGHSKQKAKHCAAGNLMDHLCSMYRSIQLKLSPEWHLLVGTANKRNRDQRDNFVGQLYEKCLEWKMSRPEFAIEKGPNLMGRGEYHMKCTVNDVQKVGIGSTYMQAKQTAAKMMLEVLRPPCLQISVTEFLDELLDFCTEKQFESPSYETIRTDSEDEISVKCSVSNVEKLGTGLTEQDAKRAAARMVYITLRLGEMTVDDFITRFDAEPVDGLKTKTTAFVPESNQSENGSQVAENESKEMFGVFHSPATPQ